MLYESLSLAHAQHTLLHTSTHIHTHTHIQTQGVKEQKQEQIMKKTKLQPKMNGREHRVCVCVFCSRSSSIILCVWGCHHHAQALDKMQSTWIGLYYHMNWMADIRYTRKERFSPFSLSLSLSAQTVKIFFINVFRLCIIM